MRKAYPGTQSVRRALALLKRFDDKKPRWRLTELAQEEHLNKTTVFRLLTALESEKLLTYDARSELYSLGPEVVALAGRMLRSNNLHQNAEPELRELAYRCKETVSLEILSGRYVVILNEIRGERLITGTPMIGTRWPAFATSTGKAIMAHLSYDETGSILRKPLRQFTRKTITDPEEIRREFSAIRMQGFAIADEQLELGYVAIGSAILGADARPVAAISIGAPTIRLTRDKLPSLGALLSQATKRISRKLGG